MKFLKQNSLSIVLIVLFLMFLVGLSVAGFYSQNEELSEHGWSLISYVQYIVSSDFAEAVFENWESEFLQMGALVVLTIWLLQKGSADSKKLNSDKPHRVLSRYSIINNHFKNIGKVLYANSLSIALFLLFAGSFIAHALSGASIYNQEALQHGQSSVTVWQFIMSAQFWFESLQNWQSEFLSVAVLLILSIYLRQVGSPESKLMSEPNNKTGS